MQDSPPPAGATPDEIWLCSIRRYSPQGSPASPNTCCATSASRREDRPRRPDHLPRSGPGRRLPAARPARAASSPSRTWSAAWSRRVIDLLAELRRRRLQRLAGAPGVYVGERQDRRARPAACSTAAATTASRSTWTWTSRPFAAINPCGYEGLAVTQTRRIWASWTRSDRTGDQLPPYCELLAYMSASAEKGRGQDGAHPDQDRAARTALKKPDWIRVKAGSGARASTRSRASCATSNCTRCAKKRPAPTSANASARARPPS